jgi:cell wall-associated NlpC family hydrolase
MLYGQKNMLDILKNIILISFICIASACGIVPHSAGPQKTGNTGGTTGHSSPMAMAVSGFNEIEASLMQAYRDWKGTPYVLGGSNVNGVDCSSFVRIVFDDYFGIDLPPNTRTQLNAGSGIRRASLRTGDLVFFRTGRKTLHVGIITEGKDFLHASTSQGVMISNLSENYWSSRYLAARRVL